MTAGILAKSAVASLLSGTGGVRCGLRRIGRQRAGILMYHRILPPGSSAREIEPGMYVRADSFEKHLRFLARNCSPVTLEEILPALGKPAAKPVCALTFDDGWRDFYRHAFPLLKSYNIPATVFLPTGYIGSGRWFWTDRLMRLLSRKPPHPSEYGARRPSHPLARRVLSLCGRAGKEVDAVVAAMKSCGQEEIELILREVSRSLGAASVPKEDLFLDWKEVREMADSGLVGFGSHTVSHRILTTLDDQAVRVELAESRRKLLAEKVVSPGFLPFCYPNGNYTERIAGMVRDAGYSLAVTTQFGWNGKENGIFALRRIPVHEDICSSEAMFGCRMAGIF
jgi:peptidoglycan/xylan/chitin deacetylase (PgdA/CDA1 family)